MRLLVVKIKRFLVCLAYSFYSGYGQMHGVKSTPINLCSEKITLSYLSDTTNNILVLNYPDGKKKYFREARLHERFSEYVKTLIVDFSETDINLKESQEELYQIYRDL